MCPSGESPESPERDFQSGSQDFSGTLAFEKWDFLLMDGRIGVDGSERIEDFDENLKYVDKRSIKIENNTLFSCRKNRGYQGMDSWVSD
jgi:hypothetical protein